MNKIFNRVLFIILTLGVLALLYLLSPILTPFLIGALLAYLANPLVIRLKRLKIPAMAAVLLVFILMFSILIGLGVLLVPLIQKQIQTFINFIPRVLNWMQAHFGPWLDAHTEWQEYFNKDALKETLKTSNKVGSILSWTVEATIRSGYTLIEWVVKLLLIPVVTFYLLRDWDVLKKNCRGLLPRAVEPTFVMIVQDCNIVLSAFFRGQLLVMLSLGTIYAIGLSLIGLQIGVMIGLITGLCSIVPYLGVIIGFTTSMIAAYVQFGTLQSLLWVALVFLIGQSIESSILTPLLVGKRIGLHPVAVIFAVLAGAKLFGFFGVLLALPVAAVVMVWLRFFNKKYRMSQFYQK